MIGVCSRKARPTREGGADNAGRCQHREKHLLRWARGLGFSYGYTRCHLGNIVNRGRPDGSLARALDVKVKAVRQPVVSWGQCKRRHFGRRCDFTGELGDGYCVVHFEDGNYKTPKG